MIQKINDNGARVILCTPTVIGEKPDGANPDDERLDQYADISRKVATETSSQLLDLRKGFITYLKEHNSKNASEGILTSDSVRHEPEPAINCSPSSSSKPCRHQRQVSSDLVQRLNNTFERPNASASSKMTIENLALLCYLSIGNNELSHIEHFNPFCPRVGGKTFCGSSSCGGRTVFLQSFLPSCLEAIQRLRQAHRRWKKVKKTP